MLPSHCRLSLNIRIALIQPGVPGAAGLANVTRDFWTHREQEEGVVLKPTGIDNVTGLVLWSLTRLTVGGAPLGALPAG